MITPSVLKPAVLGKTYLLSCALLLVTGAVMSAESELDTDLMQAIEDTNKSLASNIAMKDAKASTSDAKELESMFGKVEAHFINKGNADDAVALSKKSKSLTQEVVKDVLANDFDAATNAATNLSRTCKTCHNFYKKS